MLPSKGWIKMNSSLFDNKGQFSNNHKGLKGTFQKVFFSKFSPLGEVSCIVLTNYNVNTVIKSNSYCGKVLSCFSDNIGNYW